MRYSVYASCVVGAFVVCAVVVCLAAAEAQYSSDLQLVEEVIFPAMLGDSQGSLRLEGCNGGDECLRLLLVYLEEAGNLSSKVVRLYAGPGLTLSGSIPSEIGLLRSLTNMYEHAIVLLMICNTCTHNNLVI